MIEVAFIRVVGVGVVSGVLLGFRDFINVLAEL